MGSIWDMRRRAEDTKVAGVCGGLARHWHVDPVLVRVGCALLALSGGIGIVLYAAGWLLIPQEGRSASVLHDLLGEQVRTWPRELWAALVALACLIAFGALGSISPFGFGPAVVVALIWYFGFYKRRSHSPSSRPEPLIRGDQPAAPTFAPAHASVPPPASAAPEATPFSTATAAWPERVAEAQYFADPDPIGLYRPAPPPPAGVPRSRSASARRLRWVGLSVLAIVLGLLGVLDALGTAIALGAYLAAALAVAGLTLIAATRYGRAPGVLPVGLLLLVAVIATSAVAQVDRPRASTGTVSYSSPTTLPVKPDMMEAGTMTVDLSNLDLVRDATYQAAVGVGSLHVTVPADTNVVIHYTIGKGFLSAYGSPIEGGAGLSGSVPPTPLLPDRPTLTLNLQIDLGHVEVRR